MSVCRQKGCECEAQPRVLPDKNGKRSSRLPAAACRRATTQSLPRTGCSIADVAADVAGGTENSGATNERGPKFCVGIAGKPFGESSFPRQNAVGLGRPSITD